MNTLIQQAQVDLSPDGRMLVQYVNQASDFSDRAFTMPSLTLTGIAVNSCKEVRTIASFFYYSLNRPQIGHILWGIF